MLDDPVQLLPELLDRLAALGDMARKVSNALGGNGHCPNTTAALIEQLTKGLDSTPCSPNCANSNGEFLSIGEDSKERGYD
ncbi:hypothetical protein ACFLW4_03955 [Chloroflexota bacterium]